MDVHPIDPRRSALLLMDLQAAILGRVEDPDGLLERARAALAWARGAGVTVGYVRVAFEPADHERISPNNKSFSQMGAARAMDAGDPSTQIDERIAPQPGDIEVRKVRVGAFSTTDLADQLAARGIDTLLLAGIATSGVVLSTLRDAADRDYRLLVVEDACADRDDEVHRVLMTKVFPRQADVVTTADLPALLAG